MIQDGRLLPLMDWVSAEGKMRKLYKPEVVGDWSGLKWYSNGTKVPRDSPICGWNNELCLEDKNETLTLVLMISNVVVLLVVIICIMFARNRYRYETALKEVKRVIVKWNDVSTQHVKLLDNFSDISNKREDDELMYMGMHVVCYPLDERGVDIQNRDILVELKNMRELKFENISPFVAICNDTPNVCLLMELPTRGTLKNILQRSSNLDWELKVSIINDLACGMSYLHLSPVGIHGRLSSNVCLLDSRWTTTVSGYGFSASRIHISQLPGEQLLWTAPEMLRNMTNNTSNVDNLRKADVYSFGIIGQEIILQSLPYNMDILDIHPQTIVDHVTQGTTPPFRPHIPDKSCRQEWPEDLLIRCWQEDPNARPDFKGILGTIYENTKGRSISVVDRMIHRLEKYTNTLEKRVIDRANELQEEKYKVEVILRELLPTSVAEELACGNKVEPEAFDCVTVFFSDIVGFTSIAAECSAIEIVQMLNNMYTMFDDIAHQFDVYKVATIGDAYVVASGVPVRNGDNHATEICNMALGLVKAVQEIPVPHVINTYLSMRVGIHSGTCVAAVVGVKMPHYLLFGDTVDIAARLESSGQAMKIHVSSPTVNLLHGSNSFHIETAEEIIFKDKENLQTFWFN